MINVTIKTEDPSELLEDESPVIIPVTLTSYPDGRFTASSYPETLEIIKKYLADATVKSVFAKKNLETFSEEIGRALEPLGYLPDRPQLHVIFTAESTSDVDTSVILPQTAIITGKGALKNRTTYPIDDGETCAAVVEDGVIAAVAAVNSAPEGSKIRELNVQSAPEFRRRGSAASAVAALALHLLESGEAVAVRYECRVSNRGSAKTAVRAGFRAYARTFYCVCYN